MLEILCCVGFDGWLKTERCGERVQKATPKQVAKSYSKGGVSFTIEHSESWWKEHCPVTFKAISRDDRDCDCCGHPGRYHGNTGIYECRYEASGVRCECGCYVGYES